MQYYCLANTHSFFSIKYQETIDLFLKKLAFIACTLPCINIKIYRKGVKKIFVQLHVEFEPKLTLPFSSLLMCMGFLASLENGNLIAYTDDGSVHIVEIPTTKFESDIEQETFLLSKKLRLTPEF